MRNNCEVIHMHGNDIAAISANVVEEYQNKQCNALDLNMYTAYF